MRSRHSVCSTPRLCSRGQRKITTEEWLQRLQLQLGGAFTWATEETEDLSEMM